MHLGLQRNATLASSMDLAAKLRVSGHALGTQKTYCQGVKAYSDFIRQCGFGSNSRIPVVSHTLLLGFIAHLAEERGLAFSTINTYAYAVRDWAMELGLRDPTRNKHGEQHLYKKLLRGVRRATRKRCRTRRPLKRSHLRKVLTNLHHCGLSCSDEAMLRSALLIAFYGFLRTSEYTSSSNNSMYALKFGDVKFIHGKDSRSYSRVKLRLRKSKTSQFADAFVDIFAQRSAWCPVSALSRYVQLVKLEKGDPLYPITPQRFNKLFRCALEVSGFDPRQFSSHSLRSGGASTAADSGVPSWLIQRLGRWRSDCYKTYIREEKRAIRNAQRAMKL